jgi:hypothetical protein
MLILFAQWTGLHCYGKRFGGDFLADGQIANYGSSSAR